MLANWDSHPNSVTDDASVSKESGGEQPKTQALDEHFGNLGQALLRAKTDKQPPIIEIQNQEEPPRGKLTSIDVVKRGTTEDKELLVQHFDNKESAVDVVSDESCSGEDQDIIDELNNEQSDYLDY